MDLIQRVRSIILKPKETWSQIKDEPDTVTGLFTSYAMILAAIPPIADLINKVLIGQRIPFVGWYRWPVSDALGRAVLAYIFALATVYLFALSINILAPNFDSTPNMVNALRLAIYSMTPVWLSGVLHVFPYLGILSLLAILYGLYILFLGFETPIMGTPKERLVGYMGISLVVVVVLYIVFSLILGTVFAVRSRLL